MIGEQPQGAVLRLGKVVKVHPSDHSIDLVMMDNGAKMANVQLLSPTASTRSGRVDLPEPDQADEKNIWSLKMTGKQDLLAAIAMMGGTPICLGFLYPQVNELAMAEDTKNLAINRHASDFYTVTTDEAVQTMCHPGGAYMSFGGEYIDFGHKKNSIQNKKIASAAIKGDLVADKSNTLCQKLAADLKSGAVRLEVTDRRDDYPNGLFNTIWKLVGNNASLYDKSLYRNCRQLYATKRDGIGGSSSQVLIDYFLKELNAAVRGRISLGSTYYNKETQWVWTEDPPCLNSELNWDIGSLPDIRVIDENNPINYGLYVNDVLQTGTNAIWNGIAVDLTTGFSLTKTDLYRLSGYNISEDTPVPAFLYVDIESILYDQTTLDSIKNSLSENAVIYLALSFNNKATIKSITTNASLADVDETKKIQLAELVSNITEDFTKVNVNLSGLPDLPGGGGGGGGTGIGGGFDKNWLIQRNIKPINIKTYSPSEFNTRPTSAGEMCCKPDESYILARANDSIVATVNTLSNGNVTLSAKRNIDAQAKNDITASANKNIKITAEQLINVSAGGAVTVRGKPIFLN